ncbi:hypothetical protein BIY24_11850 [Halobacteriovorax marinus]|uniref:Uncharacterized protein n=1 Tax=Halobacteriovorax marinus (strain ATCC BAA-682 / DSM 15412 / SJ) TaxID=862908 RepID=E1X5I9_HALMS|nr:hypothetical protein [Halobacteriovorax marinus]ATH08612.1 hypothetical protein BIY24_11850 [Halobacteriovorax marinus]CBW27310.1 conserved hypothetical protein [Halobacteriovorax marinus SJ]
MAKKKKKIPVSTSQLELFSERPTELDRNFHLGGKSFYFFDFDDNVATLATTIIIFHKQTGRELQLSSAEFATHHRKIGIDGVYKDFYIDFNDEKGSFRNFRDQNFSLKDKKQRFIHDIEEALSKKDFNWKAPSWNCFFHAAHNQRPISVITARGHEPETIKKGIDLLVQDGHLTKSPNYLSIYPVSNPDIREKLSAGQESASIADLKRGAIRESVEKAIEKYGYSDHHRFGMSDDDPHNVELITEEMKSLKQDYPQMSFFVIQTFSDSFTKTEVLQHRTRDIITKKESTADQMNLFL